MIKIHIRETEKPNLSGYSAKSFFKRVDFPVPEGPETTIGRPAILTIEAIVRVKQNQAVSFKY